MKTLYHVHGTFRFGDRYGSHAVKLDQVVAAGDEDLAITTAINNTGVPFEAYLEDDEAVICDELIGERLEEYERIQAERYSQQYCESLFTSVNAFLSDDDLDSTDNGGLGDDGIFCRVGNREPKSTTATNVA